MGIHGDTLRNYRIPLREAGVAGSIPVTPTTMLRNSPR